MQQAKAKANSTQGLSSLTWLLPVATLIFVAYITFALVGGLVFDLPIWLVLVPILPAVVITMLAMVVALLDVTKRPRTDLSQEAQMVWLLTLVLLNLLALLPYWLIVVRRNGPLPN